MKIGIVAPEFPPDTGGVQTYAWHMARELTELGHNVTVFTQPHASGEAEPASFRIEPVLALRRRKDRDVVRQNAMDVWHCMNAPYAWLALDTAPVFVTVHGNDFLAPYYPVARLDVGISDRLDHWLGDFLTKRLMSRSLPLASHIFTNSRYTERVFLEHHPRCRGKTSVASCGVSAADFASHLAPKAHEITRFITICRLADQRKNVPAVLEALSALRADHKFHYTIVGDGELRPELEGLVAKLGLSDCVTFTGFVSHKRKIELLRESDLFVLAASANDKSYEGFGIAYLEANACGTPVLAARVGGAVEAVEEGVSGYFVEEPTPANIALALSRFLSGELQFKDDSCTHFAQQFSWRSVGEHCVEQYYKALN